MIRRRTLTLAVRSPMAHLHLLRILATRVSRLNSPTRNTLLDSEKSDADLMRAASIR